MVPSRYTSPSSSPMLLHHRQPSALLPWAPVRWSAGSPSPGAAMGTILPAKWSYRKSSFDDSPYDTWTILKMRSILFTVWSRICNLTAYFLQRGVAPLGLRVANEPGARHPCSTEDSSRPPNDGLGNINPVVRQPAEPGRKELTCLSLPKAPGTKPQLVSSRHRGSIICL